MTTTFRRIQSYLDRSGVPAPERVDAPNHDGPYRPLFEDLPALRVDEEALHALGRPGGPSDLGVDSVEEVDSHVAAVWPFFGQFIAHDITAARSPLADRAAVAELRNARAPKTNLEGLYGAGPVGAPYLYRADDPAKLLLSLGGCDLLGTKQASRSAEIRATTCSCSPVRWRWHSSGCTTVWSIAFAMTGLQSRTSSTRRGGPPRGTTST